MASLETVKEFHQKYGSKPNPNSINTLRSQNQDDEYMDYDESKKGSIFPNNAFEVGKDNDGSTKYTFDTIYDDRQLITIAKDYFNQRDGDEVRSDRDVVDKFISDRTWKQANTLHMMGELKYVLDAETDVKQKERLSYLTNYWTQLPNFYAEGGRGWFAGLSANIGRGMADPANYVGGIFAGQFVKQSVKQAGKELLKRSTQKQLVKEYALKATGITAAADSLVFGGADALIQSTEKEIGMRENYDPSRTGIAMVMGAGISVIPAGASSYFFAKSSVSKASQKLSAETGKRIIDDIEREVVKGTGVKSLDKTIKDKYNYDTKKVSPLDKDGKGPTIMNQTEWHTQRNFDRYNVLKVMHERIHGVFPSMPSLKRQYKNLNVKDRDPVLDPYYQMRMLAGGTSEAHDWLENGVKRHGGIDAHRLDYYKTANKGLIEILDNFNKKAKGQHSNNLLHYVMALRTLQIYDYAATLPVGKRKAMLQNLPFTQAEAQKMIHWAELSHDKFARKYKGENNSARGDIDYIQGAKSVKGFTDDLLLRSFDDGLLDKKQVRAIQKRNKFYIPLHTEGGVANNLDIYANNLGSTVAGVGAAVKKRLKPITTVTGAKLKAPLESLIDYAYSNSMAGRRNMAKQSLYKEILLGEKKGVFEKGQIAKEITNKNQIRIVRGAIRDHAIKQLEDIGIKINKEGMDDLSTSFTTMAFADNILQKAEIEGLQPGQKIDIFYDKGKFRAFILKDEGLLDMYRSFDHFTNPWINKISRFTQYFAKVPAGAITHSPPFMAYNVIRDTLSGTVNSAFGFKPGWTTLKGGYRTMRGVDNPLNIKEYKNMFKRSEMYKKAMVAGMGYTTRSQTDKIAVLKGLDKFGNSPATGYYKNSLQYMWGQWGGVKPAFRTWGEIVSRFEYASRLGEFEMAKHAGWSDAAAAFAGREVATDFAMHGSNRALNLYAKNTMFFNAGLQGFYKGYRRSFLETRSGRKAPKIPGTTIPVYMHPKALAAVVGVSIAPEMALWALNNGRREYEEVPEEVKIHNLLFPIFMDEQPDGSHLWPNGQRRVHHFFPFPKPYDFGVFGNAAVAVAEGIQHNSTAIGMQYFWKSLNQILPGAGFYRGGQPGTTAFGVHVPFFEEPGILRPWADLANGYDWVGGKITPYGYEKIAPVHRIKTNTRESAIQFAEFMHWLTTPESRSTSWLNKIPVANKLVNPIEIDYIMNSYMTGVLAYPLDILDANMWKEDKYGERILRRSDQKDITRDPLSIITKRFNVNVPVKSSEHIRMLYEIKEKADEITASDYEIKDSPRHLFDMTGMEENYTNEEANEWRAVSQMLSEVFIQLKLLRDTRKLIKYDPNLSGKQKLLETERIREAENMIAHSYILMLSQANLDKAFTNLTGGNRYAFPTEPSEVGGLRTGMEKTYEAIETGFEKLFGKK